MQSTMKAYEFVRLRYAETGEVPSQTEIARHMGWKGAQSATDCLNRPYDDKAYRADLRDEQKDG